MKIFKSFVVLFFLGFSVSHAQYTETINSNRPGNSQGAFAVGPGVLQFEAGGKFGKDEHSLLQNETDLWGIEYMVRFGLLFEELEINLMGSFLNQSTTYLIGSQNRTYDIANFDSNAIGVKYLVYDPYKNGKKRKVNLYSWKANQKFDWNTLIPAVSLYAGANFAFGDNPYLYEGEGKFSPRFAVISQNNWAGGWVFVINLIADKIGQDYPTYSGIVTLTHSFNQKFAAFIEFQEIISDIYSDEIFRGGLAYLFHKNFQADVSGLINFKDTPSRWQVAAGLSYRFDWHKQDQYLERAEDEL
ncbi:transporter [Salinimicrobium soli]|uniref:transporter n=1 Tax=Salinimicrobium soli TaxID=1254399 RepID=UPI003AB078F7